MKNYKVRAEQTGVAVSNFFFGTKKEAENKYNELLANNWEIVDIIGY